MFCFALHISCDRSGGQLIHYNFPRQVAHKQNSQDVRAKPSVQQ